MSMIPEKARKDLKKEAVRWEKEILRETPDQIQGLLNDAEPFQVPRPPRQPVSLRMDPFDLSMIKRFARKKGVPHTQLMAIWLRERIEKEKRLDASE
ncbi:MAG: hypothetical protein COZ70_09010 [Deltaproteobacteria bacterium CG_4_8_14_3_um_filter_51_11]|nr:MAG: hypothetical protein AUK25_00650 [Desulfobacteraceae bacterium CG2_30_51_40]PIX19454.1 MAG: hypothetical protein COZ70_09010 [Deltaproteobacteria bacterium CG_4_8_14_3_um_filter_51_11]PIY23301.1 MAG: hypothetical protein COZ11_09725 [Deltaproteobacteria bacterium CG_4_10_14_3_um_filter_51_14]